jgi:hypothetical protein
MAVGSQPTEVTVLYALAAILLVAWLLGLTAFHVTSGFIHLVLVLAVAVVAIQLISGRRAV